MRLPTLIALAFAAPLVACGTAPVTTAAASQTTAVAQADTAAPSTVLQGTVLGASTTLPGVLYAINPAGSLLVLAADSNNPCDFVTAGASRKNMVALGLSIPGPEAAGAYKTGLSVAGTYVSAALTKLDGACESVLSLDQTFELSGSIVATPGAVGAPMQLTVALKAQNGDSLTGNVTALYCPALLTWSSVCGDTNVTCQ